MSREAVTHPPLDLLPLDLTGLSGPQRRGAICVWGGESLGADAVSLGKRLHGEVAVFPRACPRCVADQAAETAGAHAAICESYVDNDDAMGCDTVRALRLLYMAHAR